MFAARRTHAPSSTVAARKASLPTEPGSMVIVKVSVAVPLTLVIDTLVGKTPFRVGVPVIKPDSDSRTKPGGSVFAS